MTPQLIPLSRPSPIQAGEEGASTDTKTTRQAAVRTGTETGADRGGPEQTRADQGGPG